MNLLSGGASKSLVIRFIADTSRASKSINGLIMQMGRMQGQASGLKGKLAGLTTGFNLAAAAALSFGAALFKTFQYGMMVENQMVAMEQFLGSYSAARQTMKEARRYSLVTPFAPSEVFAATQQLIQAGVNPYERGGYGLPKGRHAMDIIGGLGSYTWRGKKLGMEHAVMALQRGETRMLKPYGAQVLGVHEKALQGGVAGTPGYIAKFLEEAGKLPQIMNMAEAQSYTVAGLWSTISGFAQEAFIAIAGSDAEKGVTTLWTDVKDIMLEIRNVGDAWMQKNETIFREIGNVIGGLLKAVYEFGKYLWTFIVPFAGVFKEAFIIIATTVSFVFRTLGKMFNLVVRIIDAFSKISGIGDFFDTIITRLKHFYGWLQAQFVLFNLFLDSSINDERIKEFAQAMRDALGPIFKVFEWIGWLLGKGFDRFEAAQIESSMAGRYSSGQLQRPETGGGTWSEEQFKRFREIKKEYKERGDTITYYNYIDGRMEIKPEVLREIMTGR